MKIAVRYYTRSGNTEKLAMAVGEAAGVKAQQLAAPLQERVDVLFLGCSYYAFDVDESVKRFIQENREKIGMIACFGTSAMMKSTRKPMKKVADAAGVKLCDEEFHCRGSFGPMHKGRPNEKDTAQAQAFARAVISKMK